MDQDRPVIRHEVAGTITPRTVLGMTIALFGVVLLFDRIGLVEARYALRLWPVPLLIMGVLMIVQAGDNRERTRGLVLTLFATWAFLSSQRLIPVGLSEVIGPLLLIFVGFNLVFRTGWPRGRARRYRLHGIFGPDGPFGSSGPFGPSGSLGSSGPLGPTGPLGPGGPLTSEPPQGAPPGTGASASASASAFSAGTQPVETTFSPGRKVVDPPLRVSMFAVLGNVRRTAGVSPFSGGASLFAGGDITAIMGGGQLDLRLAIIPRGQEAVLDIVAVMGGVEILVPSHWEISMPIVPFLGGVEDLRFAPLPTDPAAIHPDNSGRLVVRGLVMMGSVQIKS